MLSAQPANPGVDCQLSIPNDKCGKLSYVWNGHASSISGVYAVDITHGLTSKL